MESPLAQSIKDDHYGVKILIIKELENGQTFQDACILSGISNETGHRLKALRGIEKERLDELESKTQLTERERNELMDLQNKKFLCETFATQVEAAVRVYKKKLVSVMNFASLKDWRAAHELLKQRFPKEWIITNKVQHEGEIIVKGAKELADAIQQLIHEPNTEENQGHTVTSSQ